MRIGIVGTGNMGQALGLRWARAGHEVLFGSRDVKKAKAIAADGSASTQAGDFDAAAAFGEVVLYTVRDYFPSQLLKEPQALSGKIVIDCNNSAILGLIFPIRKTVPVFISRRLSPRTPNGSPQTRPERGWSKLLTRWP